jgi:glycosyltransferase involved in cell wall biosynthesis
VIKKDNFPPIIFFDDGFDWDLKGNRYYFPYYYSFITKVLVVAPHRSFKRTIKNVFDKHAKPLKKIKKNLYFYQPKGIIPLGKTISWNYKFSNKIIKQKIKKIIKRMKISNPILWFFYPEVYQQMKQLKNKGKIYQVVDCYWNYSFYYSSQKAQKKAEVCSRKVGKDADLVFTSSLYLQNYFKKINKQTFLLENGSKTRFIINKLSKVKKAPNQLREVEGKIIGFVGNMTSFRFDFELVEFLVRSATEFKFVFIGPTDREEKMKQLDKENKNCIWIKKVAFEEIPQFLNYFDICIIPYLKNMHTKGILPIKIFEYFAAGKPIISTDLYSLNPYQQEVYLAKNNKDFLKGIKQLSIENSNSEEKEKKINIAKAHNWKNLVKESQQLIGKKILK